MPVPNKARSGGPKTASGRAATAHNAIKSGAYAVQVVLPGEDAAQFEAMESELMRDFEPVGMAEVAMVHDLAVLTWKKLRIDRVEHSTMMEMALMPVLEANIEKAYGPGWLPQAMPRIEPFDPVDQAEFEDTTELLAQLNALREPARSGPKAKTVRLKWPALYSALQGWADDYLHDVDDLIEGVVVDKMGLSEALEIIGADCETVLWLWENHEQVCQAIQRTRDAKQFVYMKTSDNDATLRCFNDTSRAFYRTLSALRRQQDWRIRRTAISIDDVSPKLAPPTPD
jgi:hypothetical protein